MRSGDAIITAQLGFGKAPEVFNTVDMATLSLRKGLLVIDPVMLVSQSNQAVIAAASCSVCNLRSYSL
jgi:hypothetical protein